ncbi:hypothetical protein [Pedobacter metabolipauper]|uniref:Uncharacterized protein n=1 Tax=Pedobacter metabolipauper TaxID=425513 RepID=A0A4R6SSJ3_9SPHI|nr:hypothetical protein [Pedobacter metabolipauper]TDQ08267.1 hypothetical protein ATK78_2775 [Pedobacter metabolipauper]
MNLFKGLEINFFSPFYYSRYAYTAAYKRLFMVELMAGVSEINAF